MTNDLNAERGCCSRPKVLHSESSLGWGGQEIRILCEAQELQKRGYTVSIMANLDSKIVQEAKRFGVRTIVAKIRRKRFGDLLSVVNQLCKHQPDIVCTHSSTDHWLVAIARLFSEKKYKIVRGRHISANVKNSLSNRWLYNSGCDYVYTTAEFITQKFLSLGLIPRAKIQTVPTGIDLTYFKRADRASARSSLGVPESAFALGTISTLRSWKGHRYVIEALKISEVKTLFFMIVGAGPQEKPLKQLVEDLELKNVRFYGHHDDVRVFLDSMDCFVFPSYANEGVPQALLQAMAYDLPILATRFPPLIETLAGYERTYFSEPKSIRSISEGLDYMFKQRFLNFNTSSLERKVSRDFSIENMANKMDSIYMDLVS